MINTGLYGSEQALQGGLNSALKLLGVTNSGAPGMGAESLMEQYTGVQGPGAQQQAFDNYLASPGQDWLRQQGEQSVMRNASAMGGLGGGNVMKELTRYGQGVASQDFQNQMGWLDKLSGRGAGLRSMGAGLIDSTANQVSQGRNAAGYAIGNNFNQANTALADLVNQQGSGLSNINQTGTSNISNLLMGGGRDQSASSQALAALLANIATGSGSQVGGLSPVPGTSQRDGMLDGLIKAAGML